MTEQQFDKLYTLLEQIQTGSQWILLIIVISAGMSVIGALIRAIGIRRKGRAIPPLPPEAFKRTSPPTFKEVGPESVAGLHPKNIAEILLKETERADQIMRNVSLYPNQNEELRRRFCHFRQYAKQVKDMNEDSQNEI